MKIIECVPNFSEGCDPETIRAIASVLTNVSDVRLVNFSADTDHHRSVFTFLGKPEDVLEAALAAAGEALRHIDMREHVGVHPRLGAVDVVPFIPLEDALMADAVDIAHRFGRQLHEAFGVPVYFYGEAAVSPKRKHLADVRRGGYESLARKMADPLEAPDIGGPLFDPRYGATAVGAREPLVAYNINLKSADLNLARDIAARIREANGGIQHVRAMGVMLKSRNVAQVSMNLVNCRETPLKTLYDQVKALAAGYGVEILESELIGLTPQCALEGTDPQGLKLNDFGEERILETHIRRLRHGS
ncbi:MAG: glutamate formimidoyltransferase [Smithellaceae bacterium]